MLTVTATSDDLARQVLQDATAGASSPCRRPADAVAIGFWHMAPRGPRQIGRTVSISPWPTIRQNYASSVASALDRLMLLDPSTARGRLLLLHGPTGTGKTTALRALAHAWRAWCHFDYVLDPERLFYDPSYLMSLVLGDDEEDRLWRLLVLEDCDELLTDKARMRSGHAGLGRLLNLTDGLVGQGLKVLVCLTTNQRLASLDPAVVRPGRCVAQIHVGRVAARRGRCLARHYGRHRFRGRHPRRALRPPRRCDSVHGRRGSRSWASTCRRRRLLRLNRRQRLLQSGEVRILGEDSLEILLGPRPLAFRKPALSSLEEGTQPDRGIAAADACCLGQSFTGGGGVPGVAQSDAAE